MLHKKHEVQDTRAFERVWRDLIARIKGEPWKSTEKALEELRAAKYPSLLT